MNEQTVDNIVDKALSQRRNVKDILVEMRDTSELMVDLAYSALLTNSRDLAEEVQRLEAYMDDLQYEIEGMLLLSARTREDAADLAGISHVALAAENIADSADDIVDVVLRGIGDHPIYQSVLGESKEQVARMTVSPDSNLVGKSLGELKLLKRFSPYIRAIRRRNTWIYNPDKNTELKAHDVVIAKGDLERIKNLEEHL